MVTAAPIDPRPRPELQFSAVSASQIHACLEASGCALLRAAIPLNTVAKYREALDRIYQKYDRALVDPVVKREFAEFNKGDFDAVSHGDVKPIMFARLSGLEIGDLFENDKLTDVYSRTMIGYQPFMTTMISVSPGATHASAGISLHTDGILQGTDRFVTCLWAPLHACGVDAPGLTVMTVPWHEILAYLQQNHPHRTIPGWCSATEWAESGEFRLEELHRAFGEDKIWSPAMNPGDVMLFTNWTVHGSNITVSMTKRRSAALLRFRSEGAEPKRYYPGT